MNFPSFSTYEIAIQSSGIVGCFLNSNMCFISGVYRPQLVGAALSYNIVRGRGGQPCAELLWMRCDSGAEVLQGSLPLVVSRSSVPPCLARAAPSFFNCRMARLELQIYDREKCRRHCPNFVKLQQIGGPLKLMLGGFRLFSKSLISEHPTDH